MLAPSAAARLAKRQLRAAFGILRDFSASERSACLEEARGAPRPPEQVRPPRCFAALQAPARTPQTLVHAPRGLSTASSFGWGLALEPVGGKVPPRLRLPDPAGQPAPDRSGSLCACPGPVRPPPQAPHEGRSVCREVSTLINRSSSADVQRGRLHAAMRARGQLAQHP